MRAKDAGGDEFRELRAVMFSIAYRMVGSVSEAEDIVQEAFIRFQGVSDRVEITSPRAYLSTVTTRLAIDYLRSARARRETYVGPWIPEPLLTEVVPEAGHDADAVDSLSLAFLVLLENLSPLERAVFLLRDVFDYGYGDISEIVERSEDNCRQLAVRARKRLEERRPRFESSRPQRDELARRFFAACREGDTEALVDLLAAEVIFYGDGGGKGRGLPQPVHGVTRVSRLLQGFFVRYRQIDADMRFAQVNGQPGALFFDSEGRLINVFALDVADGLVQTVRSIINPDKLGHLGYPLSRLASADRG